MASAIVGAYYGVPEEIARKTERYMDGNLLDTVERFEMGLAETHRHKRALRRMF